MKFRLVLAAIALAFMSSCAPQVLCPAYAVDDQPIEKEVKAETKANS
ncbi:MAG: hypothetical protein ACLFUB_13380 [Cyclobacteriaceae bacterium]